MKTIYLFLLVIFSYDSNAQKGEFVRVFSLSGVKTNQGRIYSITDSTLLLYRNSGLVEVSAQHIGLIKTKHAVGNNVLWGAMLGATTLAIWGIATGSSEPGLLVFSSGEGAAIGVMVGAPLGVGLGALSALAKKSKTFTINGDLEKWNLFQKFLGAGE